MPRPPLRGFPLQAGDIGGVVVSPDGSKIAGSGADGTVRLWDKDGRELSVLRGHADASHASRGARTLIGSSRGVRTDSYAFGTPQAARRRTCSQSTAGPYCSSTARTACMSAAGTAPFACTHGRRRG